MSLWPNSLIFLLIWSASFLQSELRWRTQSSSTSARLRGVSAVNGSVAWASGSNGTYARTTDGGTTWRAAPVPGAESLDFRDIEAFDAGTACLLSIGEGDRSRIYKTTDGGGSWSLQFTNQRPKAFFDAIAFWDSRNGIAVSDPVDGRFLVIRTTDGGVSWKDAPAENMPAALEGEGAFAASGTCLTVQGQSNVWIGTGGAAARVFRSTDKGASWQVATTPITSGEPSAGIFSVAFKDPGNGVIVGGDYRKEGEARNNAATTTDGGRTWKLAARLPSGFRSGVAYARTLTRPLLVAVGPSGADYSSDGGRTWQPFGNSGYHALSVTSRSAGWAVGEGGRVARLEGAALPDIRRRE
jgi:photosystem II stability/assembly factor-like uncharacterized protein